MKRVQSTLSHTWQMVNKHLIQHVQRGVWWMSTKPT